ncbi:hypothetical protein HY572_04250 [Candidatus Micrarchaeota archaeon]|nr:hypothetical protein [Candidatus Micrarchaeota archaeon]
MEFWPETATDASWTALQKIQKQFAFTLIGGWAVYLWTRQHKSKDIDIVVSDETIYQLKKTHPIQKNDRLKKYEIKHEFFDIDIYVAHYSTLTLPPTTITRHAQKIEGFSVASPETLLILKLGAWRDRKDSVKGRKDEIDILTLLMHAPFDLQTYKKQLKKNGLDDFQRDLVSLVKTFDPDDLKYVGQNVHSFKKFKAQSLEKIKKQSA